MEAAGWSGKAAPTAGTQEADVAAAYRQDSKLNSAFLFSYIKKNKENRQIKRGVCPIRVFSSTSGYRRKSSALPGRRPRTLPPPPSHFRYNETAIRRKKEADIKLISGSGVSCSEGVVCATCTYNSRKGRNMGHCRPSPPRHAGENELSLRVWLPATLVGVFCPDGKDDIQMATSLLPPLPSE